MIHESTELASNFTVSRYQELRPLLSICDGKGKAWDELLGAVRRRISERFLRPIRELERFDKCEELSIRPGFAILALDCLLIDTIQSFREGRVASGEVSPAHSFKTFLNSPRFVDFKKNERGDFFNYVRNAILHNGETRRDWKIRIDTPGLVYRDPVTRTKTINRRLFHGAVIREWRELLAQIRNGDTTSREPFLRRMDALSGLPRDSYRNFYFAYGSNLLETECRRTAPDAQAYGNAFLPNYKIRFTKHDAATIVPDPTSNIWGFVYRLHDRDWKELQTREAGYQSVPVTVYLAAPHREDDPSPVRAQTFVSVDE
jgi:hypothetical protein